MAVEASWIDFQAKGRGLMEINRRPGHVKKTAAYVH